MGVAGRIYSQTPALSAPLLTTATIIIVQTHEDPGGRSPAFANASPRAAALGTRRKTGQFALRRNWLCPCN